MIRTLWRDLRPARRADAELIELYGSEGGTGPLQAGTKVCFGHDEAEAVRTAHRLWPNEAMIVDSVPCGPDIDRHVEALQAFADAGVDELFVQ